MDYRLDDIDRRVLYNLGRNARDTTATEIAAEVNVSAGTIRNRIRQLEENGIVRGYHAHVDYERAEGLLTNLFMCNVAVSDRETIATRVLDVPGVVNVREVMTGSTALRVKAVGEDTDDLARIAREIEAIGATIEEEDLIKREHFRPYQPYGPTEATRHQAMTDFLQLAGDAEVVDVTVTEDAPVAGKTLAAANEAGLLTDDVLVVAIEREDDVLAARGETTIRAGDVVSLFSTAGMTDEILAGFTGTPPADA